MGLMWDDTDSVGVPELDLQHQQLFNVLCSLMAHPEASVDSELIADALDQLTWYGDAHFRAEESLLRAHAYPLLDEQLAGHREYRRAVAEFCFATTAGSDKVPAQLLAFLRSWWDGHIRGADRRYAAFLRERNLV